MISIAEEPVDSEAVRWCFARYYEELDRRFERGFDVTVALPLGVEDLTPPHGLILVARMDGRPVGCGAVIVRWRHSTTRSTATTGSRRTSHAPTAEATPRRRERDRATVAQGRSWLRDSRARACRTLSWLAMLGMYSKPTHPA
jgi:hypothetical protein